jgi:hypothetical protein
MRIAHIAERKINTSVASADRHCRYRSLIGQFLHPAVITAS